MRKISFYFAKYKDGRIVRHTNLVVPMLTLNPDVRIIWSASGDVLWDYNMKKPTN